MDALIDEGVRLLIAIGGIVLVPLVTTLVIRMLQKAGLQVSAEREAQLRVIVRNAILGTEEYAARVIKMKIGTMDGHDKLRHAIGNIVEKVPGISQYEASRLVHEELPKVGMGAAHFLQSVRETATSESTQ